MKRTIFLTLILAATAVFSNVSAQLTPAGAGDKDLRDTNVKGRSNELERIDRDAKKADKGKTATLSPNAEVAAPEDKLAARYEEIKTDFEQIQKSQDAVIGAYQTTAGADYAQIGKSAAEINKSAIRLNANLFPPSAVENIEKKQDEKSSDKTTEDAKQTKSARDLIVELDNAIGSFATSSMFQNLREVDPKVSEKTRLNLEKIIELSALLAAETQKMTAAGK